MSEHVVKDHYSSTSETYGNDWAHSTEFRNTVFSKMGELLQINKEDVLVDMGSGKCGQTKIFYDMFPTTKPYICVEPEKKLLEYAPKTEHLELIEMDGLSFSKLDRRYNKMIMIGVVHHFGLDTFQEIFSNFGKQMGVGGDIVIQTRLHDPEYPFFKEALQVWKDNQEHYDTICSRIEKAGYKTAVHLVDFIVKLEKQKWYDMIRKKFWSCFSFFSETQLEQGIKELEEKFKNTDILEFNDKIVLIHAKKI